MGINVGSSIVTDNLVVSFDGASEVSYSGSGTQWTDRSGNGHNGTLTNEPTYSTDNGGLFDFDGSNDYVTISGNGSNDNHAWTADNSVGSDILCMEIWYKGTDGSGRIISKPWNGSGQYNISIYPNTFSLLVGTQSNSLGFTNIIDDQWHQLVLWANNIQMGYYFDGGNTSNSITHGLTEGVPQYGNSGLPLGLMTLYFYGQGWAGNTGHANQGRVAVFRKYSKILSQEEVLQNYNATKGRFGL